MTRAIPSLAKDAATVTVTGNVTYYAQWSEQTSTQEELTVSIKNAAKNSEANKGDYVMYQIAVANGTNADWDRLWIENKLPSGLELPEWYAVMVTDRNNRDVTSEYEDDFYFETDSDESGQYLTWCLKTQTLPKGATVILSCYAKVAADSGASLLNEVQTGKYKPGQFATVEPVAINTFVMARSYGAIFARVDSDPNAPTSNDNDTVTVPGTKPTDPPEPTEPTEPTEPPEPTDPGDIYIPDDPTPLNPTPTTPNNPGEVEIDDERTPLASANGLNSVDHFAYIAGYTDGTVRPESNITRAEVATIFYRLMTDVYRAANWSDTNDFSDVNAGDWFNNAVSTCAKAGIVSGYSNGTFAPNQAITRAEFATIAARFLDEEITGENAEGFSDIDGHWAKANILRAAEAGWVNGDNGRFRPDNYITRAEVMTIVNRMLSRQADKEHMLDDMKVWPDNPETAWYYEAVQEATNSHQYENLEDTHDWTELDEDPDWSALEKEWAAG